MGKKTRRPAEKRERKRGIEQVPSMSHPPTRFDNVDLLDVHRPQRQPTRSPTRLSKALLISQWPITIRLGRSILLLG